MMGTYIIRDAYGLIQRIWRNKHMTNTAQRRADKPVRMVVCQDCLMECLPNEYHPYAACVLYRVMGATAVRDNLKAILDHGKQQARREALAMYRNEIAVKLQLDHAGNKMYSRAYLIQVLDDVDIALDRLREGR